MKTEYNTVSAVLAVALGALGSYFLKLLIPLIMLAVVMALDWVTGMAKAWKQGNMSSRIGALGALKKVSYLVVVAVAGITDGLFKYGLSTVGIDYKLPFLLAAMVTVWLIVNELISILENVAEIDGPVPPFIRKLLGHLKKTVEHTSDSAVPAPEPEKEEADHDRE